MNMLYLLLFYIGAPVLEHVDALRELQDAENQAFRKLDSTFRAHMNRDPSDVHTLEQWCRFLGQAQNDQEEDVNPQYDEWNTCRNRLLQQFPAHPEAQLYDLEYLWGDEAVARAKALLKSHPEWTDEQRAVLHEKIARLLAYEEGAEAEALEHARLATSFNPDIDLSLILAEGHLATGLRAKAVGALSRWTDKTESWSLAQRAQKLVKLEAYNDARRILDALKRRNDEVLGAHTIEWQAEILFRTGNAERAQALLSDAELNDWNRQRILRKLFLVAVDNNDASAATSSYSAFRDAGWDVDFAGRYRVMLMSVAPTASLRIRDMLGLAGFVLLIVVYALVPWAFLAPLHYMGLILRELEKAPAPGAVFFSWPLLCLYGFCAVLLVLEFLTQWVFDHTSLESIWLDEPFEESLAGAYSLTAANTLLLTMLVQGGVIALVHWRWRPFRFRLVKWDFGKIVLAAFGSVWLLRLFSGIEDHLHGTAVNYTVDSVVAVGHHYSTMWMFLVLNVATPFVEEVVFRGVLLPGFLRHIPFWAANILQASLFVYVHEEMSVTIFLFGLVAGVLRRDSQSLAAPMMMHAWFNFGPFIAMMSLVSEVAK